MVDIAASLQSVRADLDHCLQQARRDASGLSLLAVSKKRTADEIRQAIACGQREFGESYVQEAVAKVKELAGEDICWHFIGPVQSNKTRDIAAHFDWVHSVEREKIARRLDQQRPDNLPPLNVCLQVNISHEQSKSGLEPDDVAALARLVITLPRLKLRGLMAIPAAETDPQQQRRVFHQVRLLFEALRQEFPAMDTLSMGMSGDYCAAIAEGSTVVRIGTAIFGPRQ